MSEKRRLSKSRGKRPELASEELRQQILEVARKHFALHGFYGASLKRIAAEAKVSSSLVNYHFTDKNGLLEAAMEPFARVRMEAIQRILSEPRNSEELRLRIELFVEEMLASVIQDANFHGIIERETACGNPIVLRIFENTLLLSFQSVVGFFDSAKSRGLIREDLDPLIIAGLLFTATCDAARKDFLAKTFFNVSFTQAEWRKKFAHHVVTLFLTGVSKCNY